MQRNAAIALAGTLSLTAAVVLAPSARHSARLVPASDAEVVARVTPRGAPGAPRDAEAAAAEAQRLVTRSRREGGDVRLLGQAQAVLAPWWSEASPPPAVRLMRATLKQSLHDFDGALADLDALAADVTDVQAQLTRATVLTVLARYDEALAACERLKGQVDVVVVATCQAPPWAMRGKAAEVAASLEGALMKTPKASPLRPWALSVLGEVRWFSGDGAGAAAALREALALDDTDRYSRVLLSEVLAATGRAAEVPPLFAGRTLSDAELLAFVETGAAPREARAELAGRVEASRRRQDGVHRREEARYALVVEGDVALARALAAENFAVQREPADARVLLEAALAAKDPAAARPALEWLARTGFSDPRFLALERALKALP